MTNTIKQRQRIERAIVRRVVTDALKLGYVLGVHDGEEVTVKDSTDAKTVMAALMTTDEDYLLLTRCGRSGWVFFVYGNSGWDVINDHTIDVEDAVAGAEIVAERLEAR